MIHLLGIRHHGPGSARSVLNALETLQPDIVLVEGPPEGNELIKLLPHTEMQPPVALVIYEQNDHAAYFPFAVFSPEYQALCFALTRKIPARFIDLPQKHMMALREEKSSEAETDTMHIDPLGEMGKAAGYEDPERWWDHMVEQRRESLDLFAAIGEAMAALRDEFPRENRIEMLREAYMRQSIRTAIQEGYQNIAVICGAWHVPALQDLSNEAQDTELLKDLPALKVDATWIPWTYGRLTRLSGYGAGVESPGWYEFLWNTEDHGKIALHWLTKAAQFLRGEDLDASPAQVIDAVRLAETLSALSGRPIPDLADLTEAVLTVFCFGNNAPLDLIFNKLIVGELMGEIPDETPMVPLQRDLRREQQRLKLRPEAGESTLNLDLRVPMHLERSYLFYRLALLGIEWGKKEKVAGKTGTYHEVWRLQWQPEFTIRIVERSIWGNTVPEAANAYALHLATEADALPTLTALVGQVLLAELPDAVAFVMKRLEDETALTGDITQLMEALPSLAHTLTYGNIRKPHEDAIRAVIDGMVTRICVGLPGECNSLDDEAALKMMDSMINCNAALRLLDEHLEAWNYSLLLIMDHQTAHGLVRGRACRILFDAQAFEMEEAARQMSLALSLSVEPADSAAWLMGFLRDSGQILIFDNDLLQIIDHWVVSLKTEDFETLLPLLRRTFTTFTEPEIRQIGKRISNQPLKSKKGREVEVDETRARLIYPTLAELLGEEVSDG